MRPRVEELLERWIVARLEGAAPDLAALCGGDAALAAELEQAVACLAAVDAALGSGLEVPPPAAPPELPGYRVIERLGGGGGGEVFKLEDEKLGRLVAAKLLKREAALGSSVKDFLAEARALALFDDPQIVRLYELREDHDPPLLLMEHVEGFELAEIAPSLEHRQRARLLLQLAETVVRAHAKGLLHGDLKSANVIVDSELRPHILDFGLAAAPGAGRPGRGTLSHMAPELLAGVAPTEQSEVYALGAMLYELLCGNLPYAAASEAELPAAIREARPRLPAELNPAVPEALQAIALKALEREPRRRYGSVREMALDLERYLAGRPVLARPSQLAGALGERVATHLAELREWLALRLIHSHEAEALERAYSRLEVRDEEWLLGGRALSWSSISLYLGAFVLLVGSAFFFTAYVLEALDGVLRPLLTLGLPWAGLSAVGFALLARERRPVAVAFFLAAIAVLPFALLVLLRELQLFAASSGAGQIFADGWLSNRQLQIGLALTTIWALGLALRTRTAALSSAAVAAGTLFHLGLLGDAGLRRWVEEGRWDHLALWLLPLLVVLALAGRGAELRRQSWFARPLYFAAAGVLVGSLELLALDGRELALLGLTLVGLQPVEVSSPLLLDTLAAMMVNGLLIYLVGWFLERQHSEDLRGPAALLLIISPFAILEPLFVLNNRSEYSERFLWLYLVLALGVALVSRFRQRRSFYFAGLSNTGLALWQIFARYEWFDRPARATAVILSGLAVLGLGWLLDHREQRGMP